MNTISLELCEYSKMMKRLALPSEYFGMPREFVVRSHRTGKEVRFSAVSPDDEMYDQDQWDGEQQVYRPLDILPNVEYLVIYNQF